MRRDNAPADQGSFRNAGLGEVNDRIGRWRGPAKWRDGHPEVSEGEGFAYQNQNGKGGRMPGQLRLRVPTATSPGHGSTT